MVRADEHIRVTCVTFFVFSAHPLGDHELSLTGCQSQSQFREIKNLERKERNN